MSFRNLNFILSVLWNVYGECENYHVINSAHSGAILQLTFSEDGNHFYTASTDKTVGVFDSHTAQRVKRLKGHTLYVNSCHPARRGPPLIVSGKTQCKKMMNLLSIEKYFVKQLILYLLHIVEKYYKKHR